MQAELAHANGGAGSEAISLAEYTGAGPRMLQALMERVGAVTGLRVQLRTRSGPGCACAPPACVALCIQQ